MLGRTADHLFWMARYIERAENVARILEVTYSMSLLKSGAEDDLAIWQDALITSGSEQLFAARYDDAIAKDVIYFLTMDTENPSSIYSALRSARENARAVKVAMTSETWESMNELWLDLVKYAKKDLTQHGLSEFCEWVKSRSHLFRGICFGTMLRDESFSFVRLGTYVERADNTARLLAAKHLSVDAANQATGIVDYYEWSAVLRSVSAFQAYQKIYSNAIDPMKVSELLVLRHDMPRSLHACYDVIASLVQEVSGSRQNEARRLSGELHAKLKFSRYIDIANVGLIQFLDDFIKTNALIANEIHQSFVSANA